MFGDNYRSIKWYTKGMDRAHNSDNTALTPEQDPRKNQAQVCLRFCCTVRRTVMMTTPEPQPGAKPSRFVYPNRHAAKKMRAMQNITN
jgi:hypothetical protein